MVLNIGRIDVRTGRIDDVEEPSRIIIGILYYFDPRGLDKKSSSNSLLTLSRDSTTLSTLRNTYTSHSGRTIQRASIRPWHDDKRLNQTSTRSSIIVVLRRN